MTVATETRGPRREAHETGADPVTNPAADLETALAGLAFHSPDFPFDFVDAVRRLLLPDLPVAEWDAYVRAVKNAYDLERGADPYLYCDANPANSTPGATQEVALQEWRAAGDQALKFLTAAALRRYETLPATQESA